MRYEYKCVKCKRPADYTERYEGNLKVKTANKTCGDKRCNGEVKLMWD